MATQETYAGTRYFNGYRLGAWATHAASWTTTYWLCEWVADPQTNEARAVVIVISLILEFFVLHKMKKLLFDSSTGNDALGWAGFAIDSVINAGGLFPKTGRVAAWPPLATLVKAFGADISKNNANLIAAFIIAMIFGIILSVVPIRLDQMADKQR